MPRPRASAHRSRSLAVALLLSAVLVAACSGPLDPGAVLIPPCINPAPLHGEYSPYSGDVLVGLREGLSATEQAPRLARRYGLRVHLTFTIIPAFVAVADPHPIARLRCDAAVEYIQFEGVTFPPSISSAAGDPPR